MVSDLSIGFEARSERYLGLPVSVGKSKKRSFEYIKKKIWSRIQGWQEKLLSKAGKEILIKAVRLWAGLDGLAHRGFKHSPGILLFPPGTMLN